MDEIIVYGTRSDAIDPMDLAALKMQADDAWTAQLMQLLQNSVQEDIANLGMRVPFAGYETTEGQRIQLKKTQDDLPDKNDDGLEIEGFEKDAYDSLQASFDNDPSTFEPIIVEYDEDAGVMYWDFLVA